METPLDQRADTITEDRTEAARPLVEAPTTDPASEQGKHDGLVAEDFFPEDFPNVYIAGLKLDRMSLTTVKLMRKGGAKILDGITPEKIEDAVREISVYLLAHDSRIGIRERSKLFSSSEEELSCELDALMHEIPVSMAQNLLTAVAKQVAMETATLARPIPEEGEDVDEEADLGNP